MAGLSRKQRVPALLTKHKAPSTNPRLGAPIKIVEPASIDAPPEVGSDEELSEDNDQEKSRSAPNGTPQQPEGAKNPPPLAQGTSSRSRPTRPAPKPLAISESEDELTRRGDMNKTVFGLRRSVEKVTKSSRRWSARQQEERNARTLKLGKASKSPLKRPQDEIDDSQDEIITLTSPPRTDSQGSNPDKSNELSPIWKVSRPSQKKYTINKTNSKPTGLLRDKGFVGENRRPTTPRFIDPDNFVDSSPERPKKRVARQSSSRPLSSVDNIPQLVRKRRVSDISDSALRQPKSRKENTSRPGKAAGLKGEKVTAGPKRSSRARSRTVSPVVFRKFGAADDANGEDNGPGGLSPVDHRASQNVVESPSSDDSLTPPPPETACPMCKMSVDEDLLNEFSEGKRMSIQMQAQFCREHRKRTALDTWKLRKYPDIKWDKLESRLTLQEDLLCDVIEGRRESHFASLLAQKVRKNVGRTLLKTEKQHVAPGYYGPRGSAFLSENLRRTFGARLQERAPRDRLVSARGAIAYLESVLVPEAVARLIMEDMGVGEDRAREIMVESAAIGELLNEEAGQVFKEEQGNRILVEDSSSELSDLADLSDLSDLLSE